ncbi:sensor protein ZraS [mine drainage metagenome]|uniref:Sensor protein ZraS n=1 Tax=mine drainage metagenome TaxID=410659 RepID=A0A1J5SLK5_9ZZZZ
MSFLNFNLDVTNGDLAQNITDDSNFPLQARAISVINIFRFILSLTFLFFYLYIDKESWLDGENIPLFFKLSVTYSIFSITLLTLTKLNTRILTRALPLQVVIDIIFITLLMHAAGGIQSGLGLLLVITIVSASLVSNGRLALFYAAVASIGLLLEQSYQIIKWDASLSTYTQTAMLSLSCFATAWLAYSLAKRMHHSEALADARGIDLENLAQVNALITQEMHDGVIVVDQHYNIRHHNLQAESLLFLTMSNSSNTAHDNSLNNKAPEIALAFNRWLNGEDAHSIISIGNRELKLRCMPISQSDSTHIVENNPTHRPDPFFGAVIFIQDLSQLQSAAQQAKLAALGRLTANIAHEIRNPLSAISHANQLLQEEENTSPTTTRILQIIADNIQRIDQIIKDVLELNRRDRTQQEPINLGQFLRDFHTQFCAIEKVPTSHFLLTDSTQKQTINFDQRHLTQILWNLCKNGWQHSQQKIGSLSLRCIALGKSGINIEVKDDGDGVSEQDRPRLFEPFFTTKSTGNGLGLYISRELAEANGASLQYEAQTAINSAFVIHLKKPL